MAYMDYVTTMMSAMNKQKITVASQSLQFWYKYYKSFLFERIVNIVEWDTNGMIPDREIEKILMLNGMICGTNIFKRRKRDYVNVYSCEFAGEPTIYWDRYKKISYYCPLDSGILEINKQCVIGFNNSLHQSVEPILHTYALILAHTQVTIINKMINERENYVAIGSTNKDVEIWKQYRNSLVSGAVGAMQDKGLQSIDVKTFPAMSGASVLDLQEFLRNTIESFLEIFGVKVVHEKKGNMIVDEAQGNNSLYVFNLSDAIACREEFRDNVNKMYGLDWSFKKNESIDYNVDDIVNVKGDDGYDESDN